MIPERIKELREMSEIRPLHVKEAFSEMLDEIQQLRDLQALDMGIKDELRAKLAIQERISREKTEIAKNLQKKLSKAIEALAKRLGHGCNDTCDKLLIQGYPCSCGQDNARRALRELEDE